MNNDHIHHVYHGEEGTEATRILTRARVHWIVDQLPGGSVLDVGCSQGVVAVLAAERGAVVTGIDNEPPAIGFAERVRSKLDVEVQGRLEFVEANGEDMPFEARSFDHVICSEVLEHVDDPSKVVQEIFRVLRPGGSMVATVPFGIMPHPDHKRVFYPGSLKSLLDPMFIVEEERLLDRHIALLCTRRQRSKGAPSYGLSVAENVYLGREQELRDELQETKEKLNDANLKYRNATTAVGTYRESAETNQKNAREAEERLKESGESAASLRGQLEGLENRAGGLEKELADSYSKVEALENRDRALERQRDEARRTHAVVSERLVAAEKARDRETADRESEVGTLQARIDQLSDGIGRTAETDADHQAERETQERMIELERAAAGAERELAGREAAAALLRERVEEVKADAREAKQALEVSRKEQMEMRTRLVELEHLAAAAKGELDSATAQTREDLIARDERVAELEIRKEKLKDDLDTAVQELTGRREETGALRSKITELEGKVEAGRDQLEAAMAELKAGRSAERKRLEDQRKSMRARTTEHRGRLLELAAEQGKALDGIEGGLSGIRDHLDQAESISRRSRLAEGPAPAVERPARSREPDEFDLWCDRAAAAPGDEVVFMYSGTIYVQEKRANRPIRLARVYLEQERPVFFNYWRWSADEPPPDFTHPLLYQSPVDVTPTLLDRLLEADFGDKRKMMFASFPHELMIRALSRGAQNGWVTIYDARDDWEEFEKVGMAKWYDPGFEEYLVRQADVVTAVSEPLARKLGEMGNRDGIEVVPNALDSKFPDPPPREVADPPIVGYFGHLTAKWFDWDLVLRAARQHPDWMFEIAGHQEPDDLNLPENVTLLGLLGHAELATLSGRWSFAIIPFKVSALGEAVDPIKVYEYLHLGLPVLSSYMPQMRDYPATVIAESSEDFLTLLPSMARMKLDPAVVRPWLEVNRWEDRVDHFSRLAELAQSRNRNATDLHSVLTRPLSEVPSGEASPRPRTTSGR